MESVDKVSGYQKLEVWQRSRELVKEVYTLTTELDPSEKFGLMSQMRRAVVSIPSNIAEGYGRNTPQAYIQFLRIAKGSCNELEVLLILCQDLELLGPIDETRGKLAKIGQQLFHLIKRIEVGIPKKSPNPD